MKRSWLLALALFSVFCVCSSAVYAELTPPVNGEGDDKVVGVATDDDGGDSSVVDLSGSDTNNPVELPSSTSNPVELPSSNDNPVQSPSFENKTPAGMAPGGPIDD